MNNIACFGLENDMILDKFCAFLLAVAPILQHYKGIYQNAGFTLLIILFPYIMLKLFLKIRDSKIEIKCMTAIMPLILFQLFRMVDHNVSITKLAYAIFFVLLFFSIAHGCINIYFFIKSAIVISCIAGGLLIIQYILFYLFEFHLQLVPTSFLLPESSAWIAGAQTGLIGVTGTPNGFYRPSAFFLEPSHLFIYCFPMLCLTLLSPNMTKGKFNASLIITAGIILSTSGMGIAVAIGIWGVYFALYDSMQNKNNIASVYNIFTKRNICLLIGLVVLLIILYFQVDFIKNTIDRIFISEDSGRSSAIGGRTQRANMLLERLSGSDWIFGLTEDVSDINFNLPGFHATLYKYGIIGIILSYGYYVIGLLKLKGQFFWISFIIILISFFTAHTHGTFYMLYYVIILMDGYYHANTNPINKVYDFFGIQKKYKIGGNIDRRKTSTSNCTR